jgi:hypothetical protein
MAIREDVIVHWEESPRIIEVLAPSTEITIQDLVDTIRFLEYDIKNQCYPHLVDSYGKQYLSEGKYVGITLALRNARVKFQSRPGPDWVRCRVTGGNLVAYDANDQPMPAIEVSSYTQVTVELDVSPAILIPNLNQLAVLVWGEELPGTYSGKQAGYILGKKVLKLDEFISLKE